MQSLPPLNEGHSWSWSLSQQQFSNLDSPSVYLLISVTHGHTDRSQEQISCFFPSIFMNIRINDNIMILYVNKAVQAAANHQQIITVLSSGLEEFSISLRRSEGQRNPAPPVASLPSLLPCKNVGDPSNHCCAAFPVPRARRSQRDTRRAK